MCLVKTFFQVTCICKSLDAMFYVLKFNVLSGVLLKKRFILSFISVYVCANVGQIGVQ